MGTWKKCAAAMGLGELSKDATTIISVILSMSFGSSIQVFCLPPAGPLAGVFGYDSCPDPALRQPHGCCINLENVPPYFDKRAGLRLHQTWGNGHASFRTFRWAGTVSVLLMILVEHPSTFSRHVRSTSACPQRTRLLRPLTGTTRASSPCHPPALVGSPRPRSATSGRLCGDHSSNMANLSRPERDVGVEERLRWSCAARNRTTQS